MKVSTSSQSALSASVAAALLAACAAAQPPIGAPGAMPQSRAIVQHANRGGSWMLPEAKNAKKLLYVSNEFYGNVYVYNFDTGAELGMLSGFVGPSGQCVDRAGDVWVTDSGFGYGWVYEYAHGGTQPLKQMATYGPPIGCAIDPKTGNLAVANIVGPSSYGYSSITIFKSSSSGGKNYASKHCAWIGIPGYDDKGDLYVEGSQRNHRHGGVCELPAGGNRLVYLSTNVPDVGSGGVTWDGKYLTLEAQAPSNPNLTMIYRVRKGASGTLITVGKTSLYDKKCGGTKIVQPFIVGKRNTPANKQQGTMLVGSNTACGYRLDYWRYPSGGKLSKTLSDAPRNPVGDSVSIRE